MGLNSRLEKNQTEEMVTLYHAFPGLTNFQSFFRKGGQAIGHGYGGQAQGLYVWNNKEAAEKYLKQCLTDVMGALNEFKGMIIGVRIPQNSIVYPSWQPDMENVYPIHLLCIKYGRFINQHAHDLNIPYDNECGYWPFHQSPWNFKKITGISQKTKLVYDAKSPLKFKIARDLFFEGIDKNGNKKKLNNTYETTTVEMSQRFQILTDWLNQNNPDFRKEYNQLIQEKLTQPEAFPIKYTGKKPLPIAMAEYVKTDSYQHIIKKEVVFDADKGGKQICPFLAIEMAQRGKER